MKPGRVALGVCLATMAATGGAANTATPTTFELVLLGTSDMHGHVEPVRETLTLEGGSRTVTERGGAALLGGYVANVRARHPGHVLLLDGGDMLQGTMVSNLGEGAVMNHAMNALGYAAAAVGNHEFDFGPVGPHVTARAAGEDPLGALKLRARESAFPWLTSNIVDGRGLPPGAPAVKPYAIVDVDGVCVGIVGGTSEDTPRTTIKPNLVGVTVGSLAGGVERAARAARAEGATVVVAVVHAGGECLRFDDPRDLSSCKSDTEGFDLARRIARFPEAARIDAVFGGHTHQGVSALVEGVPFAQAFSEAKAVARIDLTVERKSGRVVPGSAVVHPPEELCAAVTDEVQTCLPSRARGRKLVPARYEGLPVVPDAKVAAAIAPDLARAAAEQARPVGIHLATAVRRSYRAESPLGNLVADAMRAATATDLGLTNGGGLRADLPAGELLRGALFEALPFDNRLARVRMSGAALRRLFARNLAGDRGILSVSGAHVRATCKGGDLAVTIALDDGRTVEDGGQYRIGTSDFLALGGDDFAGATDAFGSEATSSAGTRPGAPPHRDPVSAVSIDIDGPVLRDVVAGALARRSGTLRGDDPALFDPLHPRIELPAPRPFRCPSTPPR